ncbi:MAG TPA: radical SAM protein, partial [Flavobacteriales bacterium]|nr:radical SAM protein [Flavobacteriales bacterium]
MSKSITELIEASSTDEELLSIAHKIEREDRISVEEGIVLFEKGDLGFLGVLANYVRERINEQFVYFNRNFHVEPTNICVFDCKFCSYSKLLRDKIDAWEMTEEDILEKVRSYKDIPITEVHIVGGVHPKMGLHYFAGLIRKIKEIRP